MPSTITLHPHEGAEFRAPFGNGFVRFGNGVETVCAVLGQPENDPEKPTLYFHQSSIQVTVSRNGVEFIEFATNPQKDGIDVEFNGTSLSRLDAVECAALLKEANGDGGIDESEAPSSYAFESLGLTVWQPIGLEEVLADLEDAKADDAPDPDQLEFLEEEAKLARNFDSIGIGSTEYMRGYF